MSTLPQSSSQHNLPNFQNSGTEATSGIIQEAPEESIQDMDFLLDTLNILYMYRNQVSQI